MNHTMNKQTKKEILRNQMFLFKHTVCFSFFDRGWMRDGW